MQRRWICSITLFTSPSIALFQDLFVAPLGRTSRVTKRLVLDKVDGRSGGKVLGLVRRADIVVLDLTDRLDLVRSDRLSTGSSASHPRVRVGLVLDAVALGVEPAEAWWLASMEQLSIAGVCRLPSLQSMGLLNVGVNRHCTRAEHGQ